MQKWLYMATGCVLTAVAMVAGGRVYIKKKIDSEVSEQVADIRAKYREALDELNKEKAELAKKNALMKEKLEGDQSDSDATNEVYSEQTDEQGHVSYHKVKMNASVEDIPMDNSTEAQEARERSLGDEIRRLNMISVDSSDDDFDQHFAEREHPEEEGSDQESAEDEDEIDSQIMTGKRENVFEKNQISYISEDEYYADYKNGYDSVELSMDVDYNVLYDTDNTPIDSNDKTRMVGSLVDEAANEYRNGKLESDHVYIRNEERGVDYCVQFTHFEDATVASDDGIIMSTEG